MIITQKVIMHGLTAWLKQGAKGAVLVVAIWLSLRSEIVDQGEQLGKLEKHVMSWASNQSAEITALRVEQRALRSEVDELKIAFKTQYVKVIDTYVENAMLWQQRMLKDGRPK